MSAPQSPIVNALMRSAARLACRLPIPIMQKLSGDPMQIDGQTLDPVVQFMVRHFAGEPGKIEPLDTVRADMDKMGDWLTHRAAPQIIRSGFLLDGPNGPIPAEMHRKHTLPARNMPALVFYHGGGYAAGSIVSHRGVCRQIAAELDCAVIAIDYRLAPEHKFPVGINDCLAAFDTVVAQAEQLGLNPARISVGGDSAGGNAAAVVAQQRRNAPHPPRAQILWVPWVDMSRQSRSYELFEQGFFLDKPTMEWYTEHYLSTPEDALNPMASPLLSDVRGVCPAIVLVAGFDPLRDEGLAYAEKLKAAGVDVQLRLFEGLVHPFVNTAGCVPACRDAWDEAMALLRDRL